VARNLFNFSKEIEKFKIKSKRKLQKMKTKLIGLLLVLFMSSTILSAQKSKNFELKSPDNKIALKLDVGEKTLWSVQCDGQQIIAPSAISLQLER